MKSYFLTLRSLFAVAQLARAEDQIIGNPDFIHLEKDNGIWWLVDHKMAGATEGVKRIPRIAETTSSDSL